MRRWRAPAGRSQTNEAANPARPTRCARAASAVHAAMRRSDLLRSAAMTIQAGTCATMPGSASTVCHIRSTSAGTNPEVA